MIGLEPIINGCYIFLFRKNDFRRHTLLPIEDTPLENGEELPWEKPCHDKFRCKIDLLFSLLLTVGVEDSLNTNTKVYFWLLLHIFKESIFFCRL
jgi:hypothetical protein